MSEYSEMTRTNFYESDTKRDEGLTTPDDVVRFDDIKYCEAPAHFVTENDCEAPAHPAAYFYPEKWNYLDVYRPKYDTESERKESGNESAELNLSENSTAHTLKKLPVIISVHGGGWVYGTKEIYQFYLISLVQLGFACVNFNYRLAPESVFPAQLVDIDTVCDWVIKNADKYGFDTDNIFMIGDSAGGHLAGLYAALHRETGDPQYINEFEEKYHIRMNSQIKIKAMALNCGVYDLEADTQMHHSFETNTKNLLNDLFGVKENTLETRLMASPNLHVDSKFPPTYIMTANHDFLNYQAPIMKTALDEAGVRCELHEYGNENEKLFHVFHCNMRNEEGAKCNRQEAEFFKRMI